MTASAAETTVDRTTELTTALLDQGWTYTREVHTEPYQRGQVHELDSPDGALHIDAVRYPHYGFHLARLSADAVRTDPGRRPGWMADLHHVPLPAALAAVTAAADPADPAQSGAEVAAALAKHGWKQREDITERGRVLERAWDSADSTRTVSWFPADDHDLGGWTVSRPGSHELPDDSHISQHTPAAVITALALTD